MRKQALKGGGLVKNKTTTLIVGGISILITTLIFMLGIKNGKETIDFAALFFIVLGEVGV